MLRLSCAAVPDTAYATAAAGYLAVSPPVALQVPLDARFASGYVGVLRDAVLVLMMKVDE